jgi:hypothetical protein
MAFKIGDRVRVVDGPRKGEVAMVTSELVHKEWLEFRGVIYDVPMAHRLDLCSLQSPYRWVWASPEWLRPFYDGNEKGEWTEDLRRLCRAKETA